ncbi:MAG: hypothetical protein IJP89_05630 [Synergistaceae bacterium]|nr:hypothetical protein [Synergistaceae bacterium]MBR0257738.1 hypothetical protein [Synergistaceae bacterium]
MNICAQIKHDIAQEYYTLNYPNDGQRFVAWYLRNIYGLDPTEAKSYMGANQESQPPPRKCK